MIRFNKWQKLAMVSLPLAIMLNPLTIQIYLELILDIFTVVSVVSAGYLAGFLLYKVLKPETIRVPAKGQKTEKAGEFLTT